MIKRYLLYYLTKRFCPFVPDSTIGLNKDRSKEVLGHAKNAAFLNFLSKILFIDAESKNQ
jgi:hypothetical protein